jgi:uncharacterized protein YgiM (DUF1202 family)
MNSADYVSQQIESMKSSGMVLSDVAWKTALLCVGWAYVFGARGEYCTPANRRARYSDSHPTIKSKCKNYDGSGTCSGCKWFPNGKRTRFFDCRGFTYWVLLQVYGWKLMGAGATSQWDTESNWIAKGPISTIPKDTLVCLFVQNGRKMEHTGFGLNNETVECSSGVQHFTTRNKKWTHWGIPACEGIVPPPPEPIPKGYAKVIGKNVALRKDPSLQATIIMRIKTGETVKLEPLPQKEWDYVSFGGKKGWMMREFLREEGDHAIVTGKNVSLRKNPSLRATIIMRIRTGQTVNLEPEPESQWDYVSYQGKVGYMMKEFLKEG